MCVLVLNGNNQPNNQIVTKSIGDSLQLNCGDYNSLPAATVTWSKRDSTSGAQQSLGNNVVFSVGSVMVYFRSLTISHSGRFECVVTNSLTNNNIKGSYILTVNGELFQSSHNSNTV